MTVSELIEKLKDFPPRAEVYVADWAEEYSEPEKLDTLWMGCNNRLILDVRD